MSAKTLMTVEQFAHMNTAGADDFELVEGYFRKSPIGKVLAEVDCRLSETTVPR